MAVRYGVILLLVALALAAVLAALSGFAWWLNWLLAINVVALITFVLDKSSAVRNAARVPEKVLLLLAFLGGTAGAILGMQIARHKTAKRQFQRQFIVVVLAQAVLIVAAVIVLAYIKG